MLSLLWTQLSTDNIQYGRQDIPTPPLSSFLEQTDQSNHSFMRLQPMEFCFAEIYSRIDKNPPPVLYVIQNKIPTDQLDIGVKWRILDWRV